MEQVSGPVIAVGLVLSAVFVPCAFITGITGQFFRQFALTIAVSTVISAFNSLTLSPALTALLLRHKDHEGRPPLPWFDLPGGRWLARLAAVDAVDCRRRRHAARSSSARVRPAALSMVEDWLPAIAGGRGGAGSSVRPCSARSTAASIGRPTSTWEWWPAAAGQRRGAGGLRRPAGPDLRQLPGRRPRDSFPRRTKAICWSTCSLPDSASVQRTQQRDDEDRRDCRTRRRASSTRSPLPASRSCSTPTRRISARCT